MTDELGIKTTVNDFVERCSEVWSDVFGQTHVCDSVEGHDWEHICHCRYEKGDGDE